MVLNKWFGAKCRYWLEVKDQLRPNNSGQTGSFPEELTCKHNREAQTHSSNVTQDGRTRALYREGPKAATGEGAQGTGDRHQVNQVNIMEHRGNTLRQDELRQ